MRIESKGCRINWLKRDILELRIRDMSRKIMYRANVDLNNKKKVAEALFYLEKYGLDIKELSKIIEKRKKKGKWFD
jgi:hypothetical protein